MSVSLSALLSVSLSVCLHDHLSVYVHVGVLASMCLCVRVYLYFFVPLSYFTLSRSFHSSPDTFNNCRGGEGLRRRKSSRDRSGSVPAVRTSRVHQRPSIISVYVSDYPITTLITPLPVLRMSDPWSDIRDNDGEPSRVEVSPSLLLLLRIVTHMQQAIFISSVHR